MLQQITTLYDSMPYTAHMHVCEMSGPHSSVQVAFALEDSMPVRQREQSNRSRTMPVALRLTDLLLAAPLHSVDQPGWANLAHAIMAVE